MRGAGKARRKAKVAGIAFAVLAIAAVSALFALFAIQNKGAVLNPSPQSPEASDAGGPEDGFPAVDWDYWKSVNPDIVGWVTVEGTNIDYPIVRAPEEDPDFYLTHDVYGDWNYTGCPYLDAGCEDGLDSRCCVVFGHNMGWSDAMFADFAKFLDEGFAREHETVLLQTPEWKKALKVQAVDVIGGWEKAKRTEFEGMEDFMEWWVGRFDAADLKLARQASGARSLYVFCTCSYNYWGDERTLVYAI